MKISYGIRFLEKPNIENLLFARPVHFSSSIKRSFYSKLWIISKYASCYFGWKSKRVAVGLTTRYLSTEDYWIIRIRWRHIWKIGMSKECQYCAIGLFQCRANVERRQKHYFPGYIVQYNPILHQVKYLWCRISTVMFFQYTLFFKEKFLKFRRSGIEYFRESDWCGSLDQGEFTDWCGSITEGGSCYMWQSNVVQGKSNFYRVRTIFYARNCQGLESLF